jgi:flagellum-specific peptidoglycan hydrolase FlgJ
MTYTRKEFVEKYGDFINNEVQGTGILAGTLIAQAIIESQGKVNGSWRVGASTLSQKANNYFGIKAYGGWKGKTFNIKTGEYTKSGDYYTEDATFRSYDSVEDSIRDYIKFLQENSRYAKHGVFEAKTVQEQAQKLKDAGYATSPTYANTITSVYNGVKDYIPAPKKKVMKSTNKALWILLPISGIAVAGIIYGLSKN